MAQVVKLKRTAVSGKIPSTSNLELGELAINTYDGRIFFEKDSGTATISEILTTNTENYITGSLKLNGAITASYFVGDGSQLTNVSATISENATVTSSFANASSFTVNHAFETKNVIVSVYDNNDSQIIPQSITLTDNNNVQITLSSAQSGFAVVAKGGHIVSGSAGDASNLNGQPASYYLDYSNLNNIPSGIISSSAQIDTLFDIDGLVSSSAQVTSLLPSGTISGSSQINADSVTNFDSNVLSYINDLGVISGSSQISLSGFSTTNLSEGTNQYYTDARVKTKLTAENVISGSAQITDLTTHKETVSGASSYSVTHNLNESYPIVQAWNTSTSQQEVPTSITTNSANQVTVVFSTTFAGVIIVKK